MAQPVPAPKKGLDIINLILGVWLILSPWILGAAEFTGFAWVSVIVGLLVVVDSIWALSQATKIAPEWSMVVLGVLLFVAPWVLGFSAITAAAWNSWIVGLALIVLSLVNLPMTHPVPTTQ